MTFDKVFKTLLLILFAFFIYTLYYTGKQLEKLSLNKFQIDGTGKYIINTQTGVVTKRER
jgi:hypothetical protein